MLIDIAPTMDTTIFHTSNKTSCVRSLVQEMVCNNWGKPECDKNHMRLFTFSDRLQDLTNEPYIGYSETLSVALLSKFDECKEKEIEYETEYENCISYKNGIDELLNVIINERNDGNCNWTLDRNRIIIFTDAERGNSNNIDLSVLIYKLKRYNIVMDCIHITRRSINIDFLKQLCGYDNIGKYWNPVNKTLPDYRAIMTSDIMANIKFRDASKSKIISLSLTDVCDI
eukprot:UN05069